MLAIIYNPRNAGRFGFQAFTYVQGEGRPTTGNGKGITALVPIETETLLLRRGVNFVEPAVWEKVLALPANASMVSEMQKQNAITIVKPSAEAPIGSTTDYDDLEAVKLVVEGIQHKDKTWLDRSMMRDTRQPVFQIIKERLDELEEERNARNQEEVGIF